MQDRVYDGHRIYIKANYYSSEELESCIDLPYLNLPELKDSDSGLELVCDCVRVCFYEIRVRLQYSTEPPKPHLRSAMTGIANVLTAYGLALQ